jgi:hypothetical protein
MKKLCLLAILFCLNAYSQADSLDVVYTALKASLDEIKAAYPPDGKDKQVWDLFVKMDEEVMQGDAGDLTDETGNRFRELLDAPDTKNVHLLVLLQSYYSHLSAEEPSEAVQMALIRLLVEESEAIYKAVPGMVYIFKVEALISSGNDKEALKQADQALKHYPKSIPLLIYRHDLTTDAAAKKQLHDQLLKEHPNHWMVKEYIK